MGVMECPHCNEDIDKVYRTGDKKYPCGKCNMVIAYDQVQPHLDELEVVDKREENSNDGNNSTGDTNASSPEGPVQPQEGQGQPMSGEEQPSPNPGSTKSEREVIYQRGVEGLREIKKDRLKKWLAETDGVGAQTENRITMVFDRNESVHKNPHVLYNLLDDELSASASYINTIVQDVFAPEEDNSDLLESQGYTPWHRRSNMMGNAQQQAGQGGPMNATGATGFNPSQQANNAQQQQQQPQQQNQQQNQSSSSDDGISKREAEMMMQQAVSEANSQGNQGALLSGLSDATDEALQSMAENVGGLAGTMQRVIDEALVQYARENPEKIIENMDLINSILEGDAEGGAGAGQQNQPEENAKVDNALDNISGGNGGPDNPSRNTGSQPSQTQSANQYGGNKPQQTTEQTQEPQPDPGITEQTQGSEPNTETAEQTQEPNPDLDDELLGESGFEPEYDTANFKGEGTPDTGTVGDTQDDPMSAAPPAEEEPEPDKNAQPADEDEAFDEIFGDMAED